MNGNEKKIVIFILINLFLILQMNQAVLAEENKITAIQNCIVVDQNGGEDYKSLQEAINHASENTVILIKNGFYKETLKIDKRIVLIGENKKKTIISPVTPKNKCSVDIRADDVKIENLTLTNRGNGIYNTAVKITGQYVELRDLVIKDSPIGIALWSSFNTVSYCTFSGCDDEGIAFLGTEKSFVENNKIVNCSFLENNDGVELQYASENKISRCKFVQNKHDGISAIKYDNNNNLIEDCIFKGNGVHGIYFSEYSVDNTVKRCVYDQNKEADIFYKKPLGFNEKEDSSSSFTSDVDDFDFLIGLDLDVDGVAETSLFGFFKGLLDGQYGFAELKNIRSKIMLNI
ncbi:MAG: pectinesterase family protein [Candidatus Thermoplasmatota archaeon]